MNINRKNQIHRPHHSWKVKNTSTFRAIRENYLYPLVWAVLFGSVAVNLLKDIS